MMLKAGDKPANPLGMRGEIVLAAITVNEVYTLYGHNLVLTSIIDGTHSLNSYHYKGLAVDCRTNYFANKAEVYDVAQDIRNRLGPFYDVVVERTHIHIEFDENRAIAALEAEEAARKAQEAQ